MHHVHPPGIEEWSLDIVVPHCLEALDGAPEGRVIAGIAGDIQYRLSQFGAEFVVGSKPSVPDTERLDPGIAGETAGNTTAARCAHHGNMGGIQLAKELAARPLVFRN